MQISTDPITIPINSHDDEFALEVINGLQQKNKAIPSRFLYDYKGSVLFEEITDLKEYYPTRTEISLLKTYSDEIATIAGGNVALIEFGSGSSKKTKYVINSLDQVHSYVPIDISSSALDDAKDDLQDCFPDIDINPIHADFTQPFDLPELLKENYHLGFFPGSTIGNFVPEDAIEFLKSAKEILGSKSGLVIGVDLLKSPDILIPAYDDAEGVTAAFNLNLLARINRELGGDIDVSAFRHKAIYNSQAQRIEMHLESLVDQNASILGQDFSFTKGESIHTENSHKYTTDSFCALAEAAGWKRLKYWTDQANLFSIHYLVPNNTN
ncbi:MAG: L-histidine N(alpha)-methyltransferase [Methyloligellaceae bacterium]